MSELERVILYRAVSEEEFEQVMRRGFVADPYGMGGKFFAESRDHAEMWGRFGVGGGTFRVIAVELDAGRAAELLRWERLDGIGPARYAYIDELSDAIVREAER